jgi:tetratricopeptide (TPR) repeat protein
MNVPKILKQAEKLTSYGKFDEAIELYEEVLAENPRNTAVLNLISDLHLRARQYLQASRYLTRVGEILAAEGDVSEAISCYRRILGFLPKNTNTREKLLDLYRQVGARGEILSLTQELLSYYELDSNFPKMLECLEQLVSLEPENEGYAWKLGTLQKNSGFREKARKTFSQIGQQLLKEQKWAEALKCFEEIRALEPANPEVIIQVAGLYERAGQIQKAIELVIPLLKQGKLETSLLAYLGRLCFKAGKLEEAERLYEELVKRSPELGEDLLPYLEILVARKKFSQVLSAVEKYRGNLAAPASRPKTVALLEKILKDDPQNLETYRILEAFLTSTYQYERLARVLSAHAGLCVKRREYEKALELLRHCAELEPYNKDFRARLHQVESQTASPLPVAAPVSYVPRKQEAEEAEDDSMFGSYGTPSLSHDISIVSDEDVDNFIVDIELLEKFGQHSSAIRRLEQAVKRYPLEIKLRQKLKTLYLDRQLPKKAAQECLEIAKVLQQQDHKEEATKYLREAQRLNPVFSTTKQTPWAAAGPASGAAPETGVILKGDLSEIGLLDIIQLLDNAQKSGSLELLSEGKPGTIFFNSGRMVNARFQEKTAEPAIYALVGVNGGRFEFKLARQPFPVVIHESNTNLLLEGLRLLDEANRDQLEGAEEEPELPPPMPAAHALKADLAPAPAPKAPLPLLNENEPLETV